MSAPNPSSPTVVTPVDAEAGEVTERLGGPRVPVADGLLRRLRDVCNEVTVEYPARADAARDWWPIAIAWAAAGAVPAMPEVVTRPCEASEVAAILQACNEARVPVTAMAGRSGVCGASIPVFGGVALDLCGLSGLVDLDDTSLLATVRPGTFGPDLEAALRAQDLTLGHWPQSMDLSTVGGWIACRGAGQYSTRYGKIEDMVVGLDVALADGRVVRTGGTGPRAAVGPDLTQLFVGSEGVLGVVTEAKLRLHPQPSAEVRRAYGFGAFDAGLEACRRILRRGATPAVLRLYDATESQRNFSVADRCVLIVLDEADGGLLEATGAIVDEECAHGAAEPLDVAIVDQWMAHRNDVSALAPLYRAGIVVDTIEIAGPWRALHVLYERCVDTLHALEGTLAASAHQSHAYADGACLYFTFAGRDPAAGTVSGGGAAGAGAGRGSWAEAYYRRAWDTVMGAVQEAGAAISHHHGVGLNRGRFAESALGGAFDVLRKVKDALDPRGILNPGKLGLPSHYGEPAWP